MFPFIPPSPPSTSRIIGISRIFEVWKDGTHWESIDTSTLENGVYTLRIRYTDEDQKVFDELNK